ncbi:hypothetical protein HanXRQr2_Chr14g0625101 [Helianthus annuus]|uniref:Uncharacterized protein n=1 Tax=Helianthus annuus TaxID=4232 RepID=A0A251SI48_HELAN|nr:hypothetical protein HanXRQr2_Chr14g0625101 [Helianthus annuus]KAJ0838877.1 hypothetical protein HanPSC8_Chr14g0599901 [Helianthus annuus]
MVVIIFLFYFPLSCFKYLCLVVSLYILGFLLIHTFSSPTIHGSRFLEAVALFSPKTTYKKKIKCIKVGNLCHAIRFAV